MWEQIRSNKRRSAFLVGAMATILVMLGFVVGEAAQPGGGVVGILVAGVVWLVMFLTSYYQGGRLLMAISGARRVRKEDNPQLFNVVEEMVIASGISKVPEIYIIDSPALNAFAAGRDPDHAAVAVTAGLLGKLNRDQLQGVIAHEISHIVHRDILFMTLLSVMLGSVVIISEIFLRGLYYGGRVRRSRSSSRGGGQGQAVIVLAAIVFAILAPFIAQIIYFAASRRREYLADAGAAVLTRYPEGLASALEVLMRNASIPLDTANRATAPLFIVNPLQAHGGGVGLFSTHPSTEERIRILRSMAGSTVSLKTYGEAWSRVSPGVRGTEEAGEVFLTGGPTHVPVEPGRTEGLQGSNAEYSRRQLRQAYDLVRKAHGYSFVSCDCGLNIKIPPNYSRQTVICPRCKRVHTL